MSERMTDAEYVCHKDDALEGASEGMERGFNATAALIAECDRARASEAALLSEREGMTGTPDHDGWYLVLADKDRRVFILERRKGAWRYEDGWPVSYAVARYWRLPGETYTPAPAPTCEVTP